MGIYQYLIRNSKKKNLNKNELLVNNKESFDINNIFSFKNNNDYLEMSTIF
jgi:hypothetical protein